MERVIVFASTHSAMVAQKALNEICPYVVMPTPRHISASCGIALKIKAADETQAHGILRKIIPDTFGFYDMA